MVEYYINPIGIKKIKKNKKLWTEGWMLEIKFQKQQNNTKVEAKKMLWYQM